MNLFQFPNILKKHPKPNAMNLLKRLFLCPIIAASAVAIPSGCEYHDDISDKTKEVNRFIKETMDFVYLWNTGIPNINPHRQPDSKEFFYNLLNDSYDQWSYITEDYQTLMASLSGVELSMGYSFELKWFNNKVIGFVEYVEKNGPADRANIKRGDVMYKIDGQEINADNYYQLFTKQSYTLTLGTIVNATDIVPLSPSVSLTAEVLNISPVFTDTIYSIGGKQIGYLVYNSFVDEYKTQLTNAFERFKAGNVSELILDLRYNGGGSVAIARLLASMIGPSNIAEQTMFTSTYNKELTDYYLKEYPNKPDLFVERFETTPFNLNLSRLVVLTTRSSASASEMVIYSLKPYMDVVQIGATTPGKYYASIVIPGPGKKEEWAIMPLIMKAQNANSSIDYTKGQVPTYLMADDYDHELGDVNEALLAKAVSHITGTTYQGSMGTKSLMLTDKPSLWQAKEKLRPAKYRMWLNHE